jgi:hypothetical protein
VIVNSVVISFLVLCYIYASCAYQNVITYQNIKISTILNKYIMKAYYIFMVDLLKLT